MRIRALIVISLLVLFGAPDSLCAALCGDASNAPDVRISQHAEESETCHGSNSTGGSTEFSDAPAVDCAIECPHCSDPRSHMVSLTAEVAQSPTPLLFAALSGTDPQRHAPLPAFDSARSASGFSGHQIVIRKSSLRL